MATITFNVPCKAKRGKIVTQEKTGNVAYFQIGNERVKFVLQNGYDGKPDSLVHYASGYVFGRLNGPKLEYMVSRGHHAKLDNRGAAETLIARAVNSLGGAENVLQKLASVPVINP